MPDLSIQHLIGPLLRDGMISREEAPSIYEALRDRIDEVNGALFPLTRRVLIDRDLGLAACVTIPAEELERYAEERGLHPISPISCVRLRAARNPPPGAASRATPRSSAPPSRAA